MCASQCIFDAIFSVLSNDSIDVDVSPSSDVATKLRRPHLCDICGKSYTQLPGLKYHMQSVHGISDQVPSHVDCAVKLNQFPTSSGANVIKLFTAVIYEVSL